MVTPWPSGFYPPRVEVWMSLGQECSVRYTVYVFFFFFFDGNTVCLNSGYTKIKSSRKVCSTQTSLGYCPGINPSTQKRARLKCPRMWKKRRRRFQLLRSGGQGTGEDATTHTAAVSVFHGTVKGVAVFHVYSPFGEVGR